MNQKYTDFLESKQKKHVFSGFKIAESKLNASMFPFQKFIVSRALSAGKYAIFADCGLGKTLMQLEWSYQVSRKTKRRVLILAPLAVVAAALVPPVRVFNKIFSATISAIIPPV